MFKRGDLVYHIYAKQFFTYGEQDDMCYSFVYSNTTYSCSFRLVTAYLVKVTKAQEYLYG